MKKGSIKFDSMRQLQREAIARGDNFFMPVKVCVNGHLAQRYSSTAQCTLCSGEYAKTDKGKKSNQNYYQRNREKRIAHSNAWRKANPERKKASRLKVYGLTLVEYRTMLEKQNNRCAICRNLLDLGKHTHVDHCHKTKKVRGILCSKCNLGIGYLSSLGTLIGAIGYLGWHQ